MKKLVLIIVLCLVPVAVFAEELPVVCQEFPPYNYLDDDGNVTGSSVEIVTEILQKMGYKADIRLLPWNRAYQAAADGDVAMLFTFSKSAEREKEFFFTDGFAFIEVMFFKRKADNITWETLDDVKDYRIGYVEGYNYGKTLMDAIQNNTFNNTDIIAASATVDYQQMLKLANNRIDLAVCPKTQCSRIIKMNSPELDSLDYVNKSIGPKRDFYAGFSKKWPDAEALRDQFNVELEKFKAEGKLDAVFKKYELLE